MANSSTARSTKNQAVKILSEDSDLLREIIQVTLREMLEVEMSEVVGAKKRERIESRLGCRSGSYWSNLLTRVGTIELRVPRDYQGRFSTEIFERYQRSEKALALAIAAMYVQGISTRKVTHISDELSGEEISPSTSSRL